MPKNSESVVDHSKSSSTRALPRVDASILRPLEILKSQGCHAASVIRRQIASMDSVIAQLINGDPCKRQGGARGWKGQLGRFLMARRTAARRLEVLEGKTAESPSADVEAEVAAELVSRFLRGHGPAAVAKLHACAAMADGWILNELGYKQQELEQQFQVVAHGNLHMANHWGAEMQIRTLVVEERTILDRLGRVRSAHAALPGLLAAKTMAVIEAAGGAEKLAHKLAEAAHVPSTGHGADPVLSAIESQRRDALAQVEQLEVTAVRTGQDLSDQIENLRSTLLAQLDKRAEDRRTAKIRESQDAYEAKVDAFLKTIRKGCKASPADWVEMTELIGQVHGPVSKSLCKSLVTAAADALQEAGPEGLAEALDHITG